LRFTHWEPPPQRDGGAFLLVILPPPAPDAGGKQNFRQSNQFLQQLINQKLGRGSAPFFGD